MTALQSASDCPTASFVGETRLRVISGYRQGQIGKIVANYGPIGLCLVFPDSPEAELYRPYELEVISPRIEDTRRNCPHCGRPVRLEEMSLNGHGWISRHQEPESSAICQASGTYSAGWVIAQ